jgi:hypothetical protein
MPALMRARARGSVRGHEDSAVRNRERPNKGTGNGNKGTGNGNKGTGNGNRWNKGVRGHEHIAVRESKKPLGTIDRIVIGEHSLVPARPCPRSLPIIRTLIRVIGTLITVMVAKKIGEHSMVPMCAPCTPRRSCA